MVTLSGYDMYCRRKEEECYYGTTSNLYDIYVCLVNALVDQSTITHEMCTSPKNLTRNKTNNPNFIQQQVKNNVFIGDIRSLDVNFEYVHVRYCDKPNKKRCERVKQLEL